MSAHTLPFPPARKHGAKVRNRPMATILRFPDQHRELWLTFMMLPSNGHPREAWESIAPGVEKMLTPDEYRRRIRVRIDTIRAELDDLEARGF